MRGRPRNTRSINAASRVTDWAGRRKQGQDGQTRNGQDKVRKYRERPLCPEAADHMPGQGCGRESTILRRQAILLRDYTWLHI